MATEGSIRIPLEIIADILCRLPSKSLGRFRCVSKDWLSLISQPQFIKTHQNTLNRNHLILVSYDFSLYSLPFNRHEALSRPTKLRLESPHFSMFTFKGSCNGLILVCAYHLDGGYRLVVLNPTTREFLELPESFHDMSEHPLQFGILYGFGYDFLTDDYKVFTISYFPSEYRMSLHVYSLRTKTWRWLIDSPCYHSYGRCLRGVFVNGSLHWIANKDSHDSPVILAFSLADEKLSEVPSPNLSNDVNIMSKNDCKLAVLGEKLAIFLEVKGEVWLMNDYGVRESWTKILAHKLNGILIFEPMIFYDNDKILLARNDRMLIYDVEKTSFCGSIDFAPHLDHLKVRCICSESLVSPKFS